MDETDGIPPTFFFTYRTISEFFAKRGKRKLPKTKQDRDQILVSKIVGINTAVHTARADSSARLSGAKSES